MMRSLRRRAAVAVMAAMLWIVWAGGCQSGQRGPGAGRLDRGAAEGIDRSEALASASPVAAGTEDGAGEADADELDALLPRAHATLSAHCGSCHTGSLPTAVPGALAVFDLDQPGWYAGLSADQWSGAQERVNGKAQEPDRAAFAAFVNAVAARRAAAR